MDLEALLEKAPRREFTEIFGSGRNTIEVKLRAVSRSDLISMRKRATVKRLNRVTRSMEDELDFEKMRSWLRDQVLGWEGLTFRKVLRLCNRSDSDVGGEVGKLDEPVPYNQKHVQLMLEEAPGFEDFVWNQINEVSDEQTEIENREKKISETMPGDTSP